MARRTKYFLTFVLFLTLLSPGCREEKVWMDQGTITGADYRKCMCCGGWFIEIKNEPYRFYKLPEKSGIDLQEEKFPLEVQLNWEKDTSACLGDEIIILEIEKL